MTRRSHVARLLRAHVGAAVVLSLVSQATAARAQDPPVYDRDPAECAQMSTAELEVIPYEIQVGDSCARIATRQFGDRSRFDVIHAFNPGMGPEPHRHTPGAHLCLPRVAPPRDSGPLARVTALRQEVRARPPEAPAWSPAELDQPVDRGGRVHTMERAFAELTFRDTTVVTLRGDTLVVVYGDGAGAVRRTGTEATLERGALRSRLGDLRAGHRLNLATPSTAVELEGGSAVATVDIASTTRVSNHEGGDAVLRATSGGSPMDVRPGMGSMVLQGGRPTRPQRLPDPPSWRAGQPDAFVGLATLTTVRGGWNPVAHARVYRIEIARQPDGRDLAAQVEVPREITSFEIHRLPPGRYYARVATIDGDLFESRPSEPFAFEILLGALEDPSGNRDAEAPEWDPGDASEEAGPAHVLLGSRFVPPDGVTCAYGDGASSGRVVLETPGEVALRCEREGSAVGAILLETSSVAFASSGDGAHLEVIRGEPRELQLELDTQADLPSSLTIAGSSGVSVEPVAVDGYRHTVRVVVAAGAPEPARLELRTSAGLVLSVATLSVIEPTADPVEPEPTPPLETPSTLAAQPFGTSFAASLVGLRALDRGIAGAWVNATYFAESTDGGRDRLRGTAGAHVALADRHVHAEVAVMGDVFGEWRGRAQRGSGDFWLAGGALADLHELDLEVLFEVGAFLPTQPGDGGLGVTRLVPSMHASMRVDGRWLVRTRQGFFVDLDESANAAWVSAYGLDLRIVDALSVGAELDFALGQEDDALLVLPTAGVSVALLAAPLVVSVGGRFQLSDEAQRAYGVYTLLATVEAALWR